MGACAASAVAFWKGTSSSSLLAAMKRGVEVGWGDRKERSPVAGLTRVDVEAKATFERSGAERFRAREPSGGSWCYEGIGAAVVEGGLEEGGAHLCQVAVAVEVGHACGGLARLAQPVSEHEGKVGAGRAAAEKGSPFREEVA